MRKDGIRNHKLRNVKVITMLHDDVKYHYTKKKWNQPACGDPLQDCILVGLRESAYVSLGQPQ